MTPEQTSLTEEQARFFHRMGYLAIPHITDDENGNYNYEKRTYATIAFVWNDIQQILTISDRQGEFPGMLKERTFNVVLVKDNHGTGVEICWQPERTIKYTGTQLTIKL